jgi:hypothetical protein
MTRRKFIALLGGTTASAWPLAAHQPVSVIGILKASVERCPYHLYRIVPVPA